jgi:hypothetical protein
MFKSNPFQRFSAVAFLLAFAGSVQAAQPTSS